MKSNYIATPYGPKTPALLCKAMDSLNEVEALRAQRDELLKALDFIRGQSMPQVESMCGEHELRERMQHVDYLACAALAKARP